MNTSLHNFPNYIDYNWLIHYLREYSSPRVKITRLLKDKHLIRIKKGLYIPGKMYSKSYSRGVLANRIYGPSYISFEYALYIYNLIPETVYAVTSACFKRYKKFITPIGLFIYKKINKKVLYAGIDLKVSPDGSFFIATKEKALSDMVSQNTQIESYYDLEQYLFKELRIEEKKILHLDREKLNNIATIYRNKQVSILNDYIYLRTKNE